MGHDVATSSAARRALAGLFVALVIFLYAPIAILVLFSVNDSTVPAFPLEGLTLRWYEEFLANGELLAGLRTSALVAALSALVAVVLGVLASYALVRSPSFRGRGLTSAVLLSPLVIPYIVLGIALLILFRQAGVELSMWTAIAGHSVLCLPYTILVLVPRLDKIDRRFEEAARDLGAGALRAFRLITMPLLAPALVSSYLIAFTISFDEYAVASFLVGDDVTFPVYLFSQLRFPARLPQVIAVAVFVMAISLLVVMAAELGRRIVERRLDAEDVSA